MSKTKTTAKDKEEKFDPLLGGDETPDSEVDPASDKTMADAVKEEKLKPLPKIPFVTVKTEPKVFEFMNDFDAIKAKLKAQKQVNFSIPLAEGEAPGAYDTAQIGVYKLTIKKGVMVTIPESIFKLFAEKYRITLEAGANKKIDRKADVAEALG